MKPKEKILAEVRNHFTTENCGCILNLGHIVNQRDWNHYSNFGFESLRDFLFEHGYVLLQVKNFKNSCNDPKCFCQSNEIIFEKDYVYFFFSKERRILFKLNEISGEVLLSGTFKVTIDFEGIERELDRELFNELKRDDAVQFLCHTHKSMAKIIELKFLCANPSGDGLAGKEYVFKREFIN